MVYQGKPSSGCKNCRTRRIKCDETRPHCKACVRTGRDCPGYLHPFDVMLRDHTSSFTKKSVASAMSPIHSSRSSSSKDGDANSAVSLVKSSESAISARSNSSWPAYLPSPADLYQPMEDTVIPLFFNSYLYLPKDPHIRNGFMEILPEMYSNAGIGSPLHTSTLAVAYFTVAAWTGQGSLVRASQRYFTQTLPKIRQTLLSNDDSEYDLILMSILMLSLYEQFVAFKDWESPVNAHLKGAIALVNSRRPEKVQDQSSSTLHNAVQAQIIKTSRGLDTPMVPIPEVWPLASPKSPPSPRVFLSTAASEIVSLRKSWERLKTEQPSETEITSVLNRATQIDINLTSWTYWVPENWNPVAASIIPQCVRDAGIYLHHCDCYSDMWIASTWNTYRDCRILVQSIMLNCLRLLPTHDPDGIKSAVIQSTINKMADGICATVPYYLGSQLESVRLKQGQITYPFAETRPVTSTHKQTAPLMGPWHIMLFLRNLLTADLHLPSEQTSWVEEQVNRVMVIYFQR